jgi:hypothetical protein
MKHYTPAERDKIPGDLAGEPIYHLVIGKDKTQATLKKEIMPFPSRKDGKRLVEGVLSAFDPDSDLDICPKGN